MTLHERFLEERKYLHNLSPATLIFYQSCFKAIQVNPETWKEDILRGIKQLTERGIQPMSINDYLRGIKAFLRWCAEEGIVKEPVKLSWLKEEQKVLVTPTVEQVGRIVKWVPTTRTGRHLKAVILTLVDTGLRISECLSLRPSDVNLDNLVFTVRGKGDKYRLVPFSQELRKVIYKLMSNESYLFCTKSGNKLSPRNMVRDFKNLQKRLGLTGFRFSPHTMRHTFAVNYLRNGGNLEYLRRILGHSNISTTQKYLESLGVSDLVAVHGRLSSLGQYQ